MSSAVSNEGVPPPKKTVSNEMLDAHGAVASNRSSPCAAPAYRRISLSRSSGAVLNEQ
jgi:hypothetical protein